jgi:hypothetical protein
MAGPRRGKRDKSDGNGARAALALIALKRRLAER